MKKRIIFSLIGAVIIFAWEFLSYAMPSFHSASQNYTPAQMEILKKLQESGLKEGMYLLGQPDPSLDSDAQQEMMNSLDGKPWAVINYQEKNSMDMAGPMINGVLVCFIISFLLFWIFEQQKNPTLINRLFASLAIGVICFLFVPLTNYIWYKEPDILAYLLDGTIPWLILGFIGHKMAVTKS